jgi:hypothetical protein
MFTDYSAPLAGSGVGAGGAYSGASKTYPTMADPAIHYNPKAVDSTAPRAIVKIMGIQATPIDYQVTHNAHGVMDTASFSIAQPGGIDWAKALENPNNTDDAIVCEIYAGFPSSTDPAQINIAQLSQRFLGILDKNPFNARGGLWKFECSSLATLLLREKQTTLIQGQSTVQYITAVAKQAGLQTSILLGPGGAAPMSRVFAKMFSVGIHTVHPWAIIQACAQVDDCDLWLRGDTIYYWTPQRVENRPRVVFQYGQDFLECEVETDPQTAADVQVISYHDKTKTSHSTRIAANGTVTTSDHVSVTVPNFGQGGGENFGYSSSGTASVSSSQTSGGVYKAGVGTMPRASTRETLVYHIPNLTPAEARAMAQTISLQLGRSERKATFEFAITPDILKVLSVETLFELYGHPSAPYNTGAKTPLPNAPPSVNYAYFQRQIEESYSMQVGFRAKSTCLNHGTPQGAEENIGDGTL